MEVNFRTQEIKKIFNMIAEKYKIIRYIIPDLTYDYTLLNDKIQELKNPGLIKKKNGEKIETIYSCDTIKLDLKQYSEYLIIQEYTLFESNSIIQRFSDSVFRFCVEVVEKETDDLFSFDYFSEINNNKQNFFGVSFLKQEQFQIFNQNYIFLNIMKLLFMFSVKCENNNIIDFCKKVNFDLKLIILFIYVNFNLKNRKLEKYIFSDIIQYLHNNESIDAETRNNLNLILIILACIYCNYHVFETKINLTEAIFEHNFSKSSETLYNIFDKIVKVNFFNDITLVQLLFSEKNYQKFKYNFSYKTFSNTNSLNNTHCLIQNQYIFNINTKIFDFSFAKSKIFISNLNKCMEKLSNLYFSINENTTSQITKEVPKKLFSILPKFESSYFVVNFSRTFENQYTNFSCNFLIPQNKKEILKFLKEYILEYIKIFIPKFADNRAKKKNEGKHISQFSINLFYLTSLKKVDLALQINFDSTKIVFCLKSECWRCLMTEINIIKYFHLYINEYNMCKNTSEKLMMIFIVKINFDCALIKESNDEFYEKLDFLHELSFHEISRIKIKIRLTGEEEFEKLEMILYKIMTINKFSETRLKFIEIKIIINNQYKVGLYFKRDLDKCILRLFQKNSYNKIESFQISIFYYMLDIIQSIIRPMKITYDIPMIENYEIVEDIRKLSRGYQKIAFNFQYYMKKIEFLRNLYAMYSFNFYKLEVSFILLEEVCSIVEFCEHCKSESLSIKCTEGKLYSLENVEKALISIMKSKYLKRIKFKIYFPRNRLELDEIGRLLHVYCESQFSSNKLIKIQLIKGTIDLFYIPIQGDVKFLYYPAKNLQYVNYIQGKKTADSIYFKNQEFFRLYFVMKHNPVMSKLKRKRRILNDLMEFLINKVGVEIKVFKSENSF